MKLFRISHHRLITKSVGKISTINDASERYMEHIKQSLKNQNLVGLKIVVDCGNGAATENRTKNI
jgi:phosphomannomutase